MGYLLPIPPRRGWAHGVVCRLLASLLASLQSVKPMKTNTYVMLFLPEVQGTSPGGPRTLRQEVLGPFSPRYKGTAPQGPQVFLPKVQGGYAPNHIFLVSCRWRFCHAENSHQRRRATAGGGTRLANT